MLVLIVRGEVSVSWRCSCVNIKFDQFFNIYKGSIVEYQRALASAVGGKAILFVGAGFSRGATAVSRDALPSGRELAKILCIDAGVPLTEDLKLATSRYLKKKILTIL